MRKLAGLLVFLCLCLIPFGCSKSEPSEPGPINPAPISAEPPALTVLAVYYPKFTATDAYLVREVHQIPATEAVANAALRELIHTDPTTPGASRVLPANTRVLGIHIAPDGLATINFSSDILAANVGAAGEALGIASIVNTLTEFPTISRVAFQVNGQVDERTRDWWGHIGLHEQPFSRDLSQVYEPAIWISNPRPEQKISSPVTISGSARVFEAALQVQLISSEGSVLAQACAQASEGAPGRGDYSASLRFDSAKPGRGWIEAWSDSPKDGSRQHLYRVPVSW